MTERGVVAGRKCFWDSDKLFCLPTNHSQAEERDCDKSYPFMCLLTNHHKDEIPRGPSRDRGWRRTELQHCPRAMEKSVYPCRYEPAIWRKASNSGSKDTKILPKPL